MLDDCVGQVFAIFILTVAAAETSIGLAILVQYFRIAGTLSVELIKNLRG
jgi:NADH-quinone oxidoreductase subunit K